MCGIVTIAGRESVAQRLFDGLRRLEYRGYDNAGICTVQAGDFELRRAEGKLENLKRELDAAPLEGDVGIANTHWATHGAPTVDNAHHVSPDERYSGIQLVDKALGRARRLQEFNFST